jgi:hypothetical protein
MKSFRAISRVRCLYKTDVSRTISVPIIKDLVCQRSPQCFVLMMGTEMVFETSVLYSHLTRLIAPEDFIEFSRRESSRSYNFTLPYVKYTMNSSILLFHV